MDGVRLTQLTELIKYQSEQCEHLNFYLHQIESLVEVAANAKFNQVSDSAFYHYFLTLSELTIQAKQLSNRLTKELSKLNTSS